MIWGYRNILSRKNHKRKIDKINKVFELYQIFMHNFPSKTIPIFPIYIYITDKKTQLMLVWKYQNILGQKYHTRKIDKFTKILNHIKSSCIIFCTKMFRYSHYIYIYYLQEESTNFSLRILKNLVWRYQNILGKKNNKRKKRHN